MRDYQQRSRNTNHTSHTSHTNSISQAFGAPAPALPAGREAHVCHPRLGLGKRKEASFPLVVEPSRARHPWRGTESVRKSSALHRLRSLPDTAAKRSARVELASIRRTGNARDDAALTAVFLVCGGRRLRVCTCLVGRTAPAYVSHAPNPKSCHRFCARHTRGPAASHQRSARSCESLRYVW